MAWSRGSHDEDEVVDVEKAEARHERRAWIFGSAAFVGKEAAGLTVLGVEDSRSDRKSVV